MTTPIPIERTKSALATPIEKPAEPSAQRPAPKPDPRAQFAEALQCRADRRHEEQKDMRPAKGEAIEIAHTSFGRQLVDLAPEDGPAIIIPPNLAACTVEIVELHKANGTLDFLRSLCPEAVIVTPPKTLKAPAGKVKASPPVVKAAPKPTPKPTK